MKKIIFSVLLLCSTLGFCQNTEYLDDEKMTKFANDLTELPFSERDCILKAVELFKTTFKDDKECADWGYQLLYYYHELACEDKTNTLHKTWSDEQIRALKVHDIEVISGIRSGMKKFEKEYAKYGYRVMSYEDTSYAIEVQPAFLYNSVSKYLTDNYAYYRKGWIAEHDYPIYWHAKLVVSLSEVMRRVQWRDELLDKNPDFIRYDLVTREIEKLSFAMTKGLENTAVYDDKGYIKKEYKDALQTYYRAHTKTTWGLYYTEYIHRLALNKYRNSDEIDRWVLSTLFPEDRKNIDPLLKYKDILVDNLMD
ncbi:MAG: hypothetical protein HUK18_02290 [Bacteroidales bacterium]|nr:hypothetical protein [Bacteroidales bacterium]